MKLLFDQGTRTPLLGHIPEHMTDTLAEKGWSEKDNGELLVLAEREGYEVLVKSDRNLRHQQDLVGRQIGMKVLLSANWPEIRRRTREISQVIAATRPGDVIEIPIRHG